MVGPSFDSSIPMKSAHHPRYAAYLRSYRLFLVSAGLAGVVYLLLFWRTNEFQLIGGFMFTIIGSLFTFRGYLFTRQDRYKSAGVFTVLGLIIVLASPLLVTSNAQGYLIVSGVLIIALASLLLFDRWISRLAAIVLFLARRIV